MAQFPLTLPLLVLGLTALAAGPAGLQANAVIQAKGELPADLRDRHGDTVGGIGSGIVFDEKNDVYLCISDRGPGDGTLPYTPRIAVLKIPETGDRLEPVLVDTILLTDENGRPMTGLIPDDPGADTPRMKDGRTCIDPEALALSPQGTIFVSDEYAPCLYEFTREGKMLRRIGFPEEFQPRGADGRIDYTDNAELVSGRHINQGPEGMCLLPDGKTAAVIFQSGLAQEGGRESGLARIAFIDLATGKLTASYLHRFSDRIPDSGQPLGAGKVSANDLVALDSTRFLLLERDKIGRDGGKSHAVAAYKSVWLLDTKGATNLLEHPIANAVPVRKAFLFNLAGLVPDPGSLNAKWEGICVLPSSGKSEITLLMTADNDFLTPLIHESGSTFPFPRAEDAVPSQFFKIRAALPEIP